jgi:hypothetical protein
MVRRGVLLVAALMAGDIARGPIVREVEHERPPRPRRNSTPESRRAIATIAAAEAARPLDSQQPWISLGPQTGETVDQNGVLSNAESGLVEAIRIDPRSASTVLVATAGGGIWKTTNFDASTPTWQPITDALGNLAVGAFDLDPHHPDTIYVGLGEPYYEPGGFVQKTGDGGQTFGPPVALGGAENVRDLRVDPTNSSVVLVATDLGLFRSADAGATFNLIDLPNAGGLQLNEAIWSIVYTGHDASGSHWEASGVAACDVGWWPPEESGGRLASTNCPHGNPGAIWGSVDGGVTWTMATVPAGRMGRITLAAGNAQNPATTVVYALVGNQDESHAQTVNILRSDDAGATFVSARGTLSNPDTVCTDLNVGSSQSGFNQAVAVDPQNADHVILAGLFCSFRTQNGRSAQPSWQVVSDVYGPQTTTGCGTIPYVHSDFHAALIANGKVYLGGDGGIEVSPNALTVAAGSECSTTWQNKNRGLTTHLCYSITSGDPRSGDPQVVYTGMQDLSTRWRDPTALDRWDTINLSDGTGGAVARTSTNTIYWAAQAGSPRDNPTPSRTFCLRKSGTNCQLLASWQASNPTLPATDTEAFVTNFAPLDADVGGGVLSHSNFNVWKADGTPTWTQVGAFGPNYYVNGVAASPKEPGLYGAALYDHVAVTADGGAHWATSQGLGLGGKLLDYSQSVIAFPATTPAGTQPGDVFVVGSASELLNDGNVVPQNVGHLFITRDRGMTWASFAGDLPNVPVWSVQYDSADAANQTLYVATEIGVYRTNDAGQTWHRLGLGLPMVRTTGLYLAHGGSFLRASTWGRGVWQIDLMDGSQGSGGSGGGNTGGAGGGAPMNSGGCAVGGGGSPADAWLVLAFLLLLAATRPDSCRSRR